MHQLTTQPPYRSEPSPYRVLSNVFLVAASKAGLPVDALAFPGEDDFAEKLASPRKDNCHTEIVRIRNNICHGNIFEFVRRESWDGTIEEFFTPEELRDVTIALLDVSFEWAKALGEFRRTNRLRHSGPVPPIPSKALIIHDPFGGIDD